MLVGVWFGLVGIIIILSSTIMFTSWRSSGQRSLISALPVRRTSTVSRVGGVGGVGAAVTKRCTFVFLDFSDKHLAAGSAALLQSAVHFCH